ncbi:MAG: hypothetical protein K0S18_1354 [Anaerocolumna sp.]|jgi:hypothetical protein|nr:hypothetical protein [Anaerocolumna sp.]
MMQPFVWFKNIYLSELQPLEKNLLFQAAMLEYTLNNYIT